LDNGVLSQASPYFRTIVEVFTKPTTNPIWNAKLFHLATLFDCKLNISREFMVRKRF
jgi:hypothetical protein